MANSTVLSIDPNFLLLDTYSVSDENLIANQEVTSTFNPETDYIEYYVYGLNNSLLYPSLEDGTIPYSLYSLLDNDIYINPSLDLQTIGFDQGGYNTLYNFYSNRLNSSFSTQYFISEISSDRTEIRLDSNDIDDVDIISSVNAFISERSEDEFFPDFLLNFGSNRTVIANNIVLDGNTVLIKLYDPLPPQFNVKSTLWVVEEISSPSSYNVVFEEQILEEEDTSIQLKGPNLNLDLKDQINNSTEAISLSNLDSSPLTGSYQQLQSLFNEEGVQINVDYTKYSNFVNFSSIKSRIENFEYKLQLIESYTDSANSGSNVPGTGAVSGSKGYYDSLINDTITNFDGYEYFLYFTSGSKSWPKSNTEPPFQNLATTDASAISWYDEQITSASSYDELNQDNLFYDIPEYLRNDSQNQQYIDFVEMVGQHFDNIWIYLKDISNKYNADNRINAGISKDLISQALRDFSLKIYQNNFSSDDIYSSFLGLTPSGSLFPFPNITGSLPTPEGFEYVDTLISSSTDAVPLDDVNKRIYKRLYHNLPYLLKSKGTIAGIKTLLNIYGVPDTILRVSEFGGKDKINANDYDYWYNKFNYEFQTGDTGKIQTPWSVNSAWNAPDDVPESIQFRFKTLLSDNTPLSQSLWSLDNSGDVRLVLEYDTSLLDSGSFSGSILDPYYQYANLKFYPNFTTDPTEFASVYLPFLDNGWWSVMVNRDEEDFELIAANKIYNGQTGTEIGFIASSSISATDDGFWFSGTNSYFPSNIGITNYDNFSGSYQEIRYYSTQISHSVFKDYTMNPLSFEGNSIASGSLDQAPNELIFRGTLGGELYTGSTSIHPKVAGSWETTSSFALNSNFNIIGGDNPPIFGINREYLFFDQPAVGVKNRINDKIRSVDLSLPTYNTIEGALIPDANTLSNQQSIQQDKTRDDIYTNNVNLLEVTFSPQNELNDDIISQLGHFNIGDLIGDPREISSSAQSYPELDKLRQDYFLKYVHENYDFNDYVRLIKFFDNSLFKMIKDFVPARTSLASGITIKPHILERQKYPLPQAQWEDLQYSGSAKSFPLDYATGSLQVTSGGNGGSFENFNHLSNFTQSWSGSNATPSGSVSFIQSDAPEFINGEFSGSTILVEDGELNPDNPLKKENVVKVVYDVISRDSNVLPGSDFTDSLPGELRWDYFVADTGKGNGLFCNRIYINILDKNNLDITEAITNLKFGDSIEFDGRIGITSGGIPPVNTYYNRTIKGIVGSVAKIHPQVYSIIFSPAFDLGIANGLTLGATLSNNPILFSSFLLTPNITYSDYNAVLGNATGIRPGTLFQDIDYSSNATTPVNFEAILSGSATKANVPDSNYSTKRIILPRYDGSRSVSNGFNLPSGIGGLGTLPNVEQDRAYFAYFDYVSSTSPEWGNDVKDKTSLSLRYYVDGDGNVIEPTSDSNGVNLSIVRQTFTEGETAVLSFDDRTGTTTNAQNVSGEQNIFKSGKRVVPIIYSQTSSVSEENPDGGSTGSIQFIAGNSDILGEVPGIGAYQFRAQPIDITYDTTNEGDSLAFGDVINQENDVNIDPTFTTITFDDINAPNNDSPADVGVEITFMARINIKPVFFGNGVAKFQWYKNGYPVANTSINLGENSLLPSSARFGSIGFTDSNVQSGDTFEVRITKIINNLTVRASNSSISTTQNPASSTGVVTRFFGKGASAGTLTKNIFLQDTSGADIGLNSVYQFTQVDISGSGFNPIENQFTIQPGDEIRFKGTEAYTYKILEVGINASNQTRMTLDKNLPINWSNSDLDHFVLRRYVDEPNSIIVDANNPLNGSSPGFFMPLYATKGIEDNFDNIIQKLKTDQLI